MKKISKREARRRALQSAKSRGVKSDLVLKRAESIAIRSPEVSFALNAIASTASSVGALIGEMGHAFR